MELEQAKEELWEKLKALNRHIESYEKTDCKTNVYMQLVKEKQSIETVLQALEKLQKQCKELIKEKQELTSALLDSIPKKKIEDKIEYLEIRKAECDYIESKVRLDVKINSYKELLEDK